MEKDVEEKISQLQILEQNLQNFSMQKQSFQAQLLEIDNAIEELSKNKKESYKIIGPIMVLTPAEELKKDLESRKEVVELRVKNFEKQEEKIKEKAEKLQEEVMKKIKNE
jgi:prefoldin beta subunit